MRMTRGSVLRSWMTGAIVLAAVVACGSGPSTDMRKPSQSVDSPTASTSSFAASATTDAETVLRRYFDVLDKARQNPASPITQLTAVATSTQLTAQQRLVTRERQQNLRQTGATSLDEVKVQSVNLDNSDPSTAQVPTVTIDVCWDVSHADLVDATGHSVISPSRVNRGWTRYTVANYEWAKDPAGGWRVASSQDLSQAPCVAP